MEYPGPYCKQLHLKTELLKEAVNLPVLEIIPNGLVLELKLFCDSNGKNVEDLYQILCKLNKQFSAGTCQAVYAKISRLIENKKKLAIKKKVPGVKNFVELCEKEFVPPVTRSNKNRNIVSEEILVSDKQTDLNCKLETKNDSVVSVYTQTGSDDDHQDELKNLNLVKYSCHKLTKKATSLEKNIQEKFNQIHVLEKRIGHFSIRNVNKRDETAKKNLHALRNAQQAIVKLEKQLKSCSETMASDKLKLQQLNEQNCTLTEQLRSCKDSLENEKYKKIAAQKKNSYLRSELDCARKSIIKKCDDSEIMKTVVHCQEEVKQMKLEIASKDEILQKLDEINENKIIQTKNENGTYNNNLRMCIMELAGLEVAVEKVSPIIKTICFYLTGIDLDMSDLPNPHTVQSIIDEGHFLAKTYIATKLDDCQNWGISRDGTTRRKQKILDTSVTLDSGDVMSLGFNRVHRETAVAINDSTKTHLNELEAVYKTINSEAEPNIFIAKSLEKLSYTMSDRASNEKKANELLDQWRDSVLVDVENKDIVHHFHCMAHTLLAFHSYTNPGIKDIQNYLVEKSGPLGRDKIAFFKLWGKKETVPERTARTVSEVFGPSGDHHGVRDRWDAYCSENGVKSCIGNYKDNRFNSIFETSAQIVLHRHDFINVLNTIKNRTCCYYQ